MEADKPLTRKRGLSRKHATSSESHFVQATRHLAEGRRIVAQQRARVARLKALGCDISAAERLLSQFESTLAIFEDDLRPAEATHIQAEPSLERSYFEFRRLFANAVGFTVRSSRALNPIAIAGTARGSALRLVGSGT
jgi:hypothetical protein